MKKFMLFLICLGLAGCATLHFPVVGKFQDSNELFIGQIVTPLNGTAFIEVKGGVSGMTCSGNSVVTYYPPNGGIAGQSGIATLKCDDGRIIKANFTCKTLTTGYGSGFDQNGGKFTFTFGMSEKKALKFIEEEQAKSQNNNGAVSNEHYKELMGQVKKDQAPIQQAVEGEANSIFWKKLGLALSQGMVAYGQGMTRQNNTYNHQPIYTNNTPTGNTSYCSQIYNNNMQNVGYIQNNRIYNNNMQDVGYIQNNRIYNNNMENTGYIQNSQIYNNKMENVGRVQNNN